MLPSSGVHPIPRIVLFSTAFIINMMSLCWVRRAHGAKESRTTCARYTIKSGMKGLCARSLENTRTRSLHIHEVPLSAISTHVSFYPPVHPFPALYRGHDTVVFAVTSYSASEPIFAYLDNARQDEGISCWRPLLLAGVCSFNIDCCHRVQVSLLPLIWSL